MITMARVFLKSDNFEESFQRIMLEAREWNESVAAAGWKNAPVFVLAAAI
jgi:hypothetical protein